MTPPYYRTILGALLGLLLGTVGLRAQSISISDIDVSRFPILSAKIYAFDASGRQQSPTAAELSLKENGIDRSILSVTCPPQAPPRDLSSVLVVDASGSMAAGPGLVPNIMLARAAATAWVNALPLGGSDCAITSFDLMNYLHQDFTTDRAKLTAAIGTLVPNGGTDYDMGLLHPAAGGLQISKRGTHKRVIVFLTDGISMNPTSVSSIVAEANRQDCSIFVVTLGMPCPQVLRDVADGTGASWYENVTSVQQAEEIYRRILYQAQSDAPCEITWQSTPCPAGNRDVDLTWSGRTTRGAYEVPAGRAASLSFSPGAIFLRSKPVGVRFDTTVTVTAVNSGFTVTTITSSNPAFTISPTSFTIAAGSTQDLTVSFTPVDSSYAWTEFSLESDLCAQRLYASAAFPARRSTAPAIHLDHPNGGEVFFVGSDTVITWSGIAPSDSVILELSLDAGATWRSIEPRVAGGTYSWRVPNTPSDRCLARVTRAPVAGTDASGLKQLLNGHSGNIWESAWSPDGTRLVTAGDATAIVWDVETGRQIFRLSSHNPDCITVDWSSDGRHIVTAGADFLARIWDASTGAFKFTLAGHGLPIVDARFSPDGTRVATASFDGTAKVWNVATGGLVTTLTGARGYVRCVSWNPTGTRVATISDDGAGHIYDATTGALQHTLTGHAVGGLTIQWNHAGTHLVSGAADGARIWNASTGSQVFALAGHTNMVEQASFSWDDARVITACDDGVVRVFSTANGARLFSLTEHTGEAFCATFNVDASYIATAGADSKVFLFDGASGQKLQEFTGHRGLVSSTVFSPDGQRLASTSFDQDARIWELPEQLVMTDQSDAVFSIIAPTPRALDVDMGRVLVGSGKDSVIVGFAFNESAAPFRVDSIRITGAAAGRFSFVSGMPPFQVAGNGSHDMEIRFAPDAVGPVNTRLVIYTSTGSLLRNLRGEGIAPELEIVESIIDFGPVPVGAGRDTLRAVTVRNVGSAPLAITGTRHAGPNDADFTTLAGGPFSLAPGDTARVDLRFLPTAVGRTSGRLLFDYDGPASPATVLLFGEGIIADQPMVEVVAGEIDFGTVIVGADRDSLQAATIRNIGTVPVTIASSQSSGTNATEFSNIGNMTVTIAPGDTARVDLRFAPVAAGPRTADLLVDYGGTAPAVVRMTGVGVEPAVEALATLEPGDAAAFVGDTVVIPIILKSQTNLATSGATGFATRLRFNGTLLEPIDDTPKGMMEGGDRVIPLSLPVTAGADGVLATLRFRSGLGNDTLTALVLEQTQALDGAVTMSVEVGSFHLLGVCLEGGPRLVNPTGSVVLKLGANPTRSSVADAQLVTIERGRTTLAMTDMSGRLVRTFVDEELVPGARALQLDLHGVAAGMYLLTLRTPTEQRTILVEVSK